MTIRAREALRRRNQNRPLADSDVRMVATGTLNSTNPSWASHLDEPVDRQRRHVLRRLRRPNFLGTSQIIAAITITGDSVCRSTNVVYRLDTESARAFLGQNVTLP